MNENPELMPDWTFWADLLNVNLYTAIALSLNFDLDKMPGYNKKTELLTFGKTPEEFQRRRSIAENAIASGSLAKGVGKVEVSAFVRWAKSRKAPWDMPAELEALQSVPTHPSVVEPAGNDSGKPWLVADSTDPTAEYSWYVSARYFARELVKKDSTLLVKKEVLADKVSRSLEQVGVYKRGGKTRLNAITVLKAFSNIKLG